MLSCSYCWLCNSGAAEKLLTKYAAWNICAPRGHKDSRERESPDLKSFSYIHTVHTCCVHLTEHSWKGLFSMNIKRLILMDNYTWVVSRIPTFEKRLRTLQFLKLSKNTLRWFLKAKSLNHKTICPSGCALVSRNKHFDCDSSFQVGCKQLWISTVEEVLPFW